MLRIFQIYFDEQSRQNCFEHPLVTPHRNSVLSHYFENQVIVDLRPYPPGYVGVWSHRALYKLRKAGNKTFSVDRLLRICEEGRFDVLGFHHIHRRQTILYDSVKQPFDSMFDYLMRRMGLPYDSRTNPRFNILQNHFIARSEIMNGYADFLASALDVMERDEALKKELEKPVPYKPESRVRYTFHPFVCEKLISAYLHLHPELVCRYYKRYETLLFPPTAAQTGRR